jgi:hypothetical protein
VLCVTEGRDFGIWTVLSYKRYKYNERFWETVVYSRRVGSWFALRKRNKTVQWYWNCSAPGRLASSSEIFKGMALSEDCERDGASMEQKWVFGVFGSRNSTKEVLEVLLNERVEDYWCYRRNVSVTCPVEAVFRFTEEGIPYLSPEIVLLYKAKYIREQDGWDLKQPIGTLRDEKELGWKMWEDEIQS